MARYGDKTSGLSSLFNKNAQSQKNKSDLSYSSKMITSASMDSLGQLVESADHIRAENENKERVEPVVDFSRPENFAKYGSAAEYYETSIERIFRTYPYDGSKKEKIQWSLSSSYLDNYILENEYPRTNGFVLFDASNGGAATISSISNDPGTGNERYGLVNSPQYVSVKGGPNQASLPIYEQGLNKSPDFKKAEHKANLYNVANKRTKNITINGATGNTVELWIRSDSNSITTTKAVFDAWNGDGSNATQPGSASYGRFLLESRFETDSMAPVDGHLLHLTYMSGTAGAERVPIFPISVVGSPAIGQFNHYAVTVVNSGITSPSDKGLRVKTYLNGKLIENKLTGTAVSDVTGNPTGGINANIGAYRTYPTEYVKAAGLAAGVSSFEGAGNLTASVDEFRFWKISRTERQIGTNWFTQVGAGTNTDTSNTDLGIYFKFNEGITGNSSSDQTILDYSGRVSNGLYNNYSSTSRSTGSAMVLAKAAEREFKDPILYPSHPDVDSYKDAAIQKGEEWDYRNPSILYNTLPAWIHQEDPGTAKILTQILSSYFDTLHLQIEEIPKIKTLRYLSSSVNNGVGPKPLPFASKLLTNSGFVAPEIFAETDVVASLFHRDDAREFERKLYDIKNYIYQNIYNNLSFINKSKGTTKSIRNLIRCFGVDEEIYKINMYADNAQYTLSNNFVDKTIRKTYADFNHIDRNEATVYSYKNNSESDNGFLTGSLKTSNGFDIGFAMTVESEVILPRKPENGEKGFDKHHFAQLSSSMFGIHSAKQIAGSDAATVMTWDSDDFANFQAYAVSDTAKVDEQASKSVKFVLKSYNSVLPELTSSFFFDQYKDTKWNFAVRVKPKEYGNVSSVITGSAGKEYDVEFEGYSVVSDVVLNHFLATGSISNSAGLKFITQKKRLYAGAHRTNFTGSVRERSDVLVSSCRYWVDNITSEELKAHAIDPKSIGVKNAEKNAYLFVTKYEPAMKVPRMKTLALNWEFDTVTGSDGSGQFLVKDSSYTINQDAKFQNWDKTIDLKNLLESNHDGRGDFFQLNQTSSISREYLQAFKQQLPENINDSNMVNVAITDDLTFTKNTLPIKFSFALEKSMYQTISEDIINFFFASKEASALENLVGDPVNRYRMNYKSMEKVRSLFFNTIGNTPSLEKYLNYYKWLDNSISEMVKQLVPASANMPGVRNVIEGHLLDRGGKYQTKFPTLESKFSDPEACLRGVNELTYDWQYGHAPTPPDAALNQDDNCLWWNKRALRDDSGLSSGNSLTDHSRKMIHSASVQVLNRKFCSPIRFKVDRLALRQDLNKRQVIFAETPVGTGENLKFNTSTFSKPVDCDDTIKINPQFKFKPQFRVEGSVYQGQMVSPVVFYSSSSGIHNTDPTGYFKTTQHLQDYYSETKDIPMQGPFTEQHVGGYQYRHAGLNIGLASVRQEGWYTTTTTVGGDKYFIIYNPSAISTGYPRAGYSRDHIAKSYVNIKNIKNVNTKNNISAIANISFNSAASDTASAYAGKEIIIISTDQTIRKYRFLNGGAKSTGDLVGGRGATVIVQINGVSGRDKFAIQLALAIKSNNGHKSKIDVKYNTATNIMTLTQTQMGQNGNTKIDARKLVKANCFTHTMFLGGGGFGKANAGIQNDLASSVALGNYTHDYEIVQIPGRSINNQYFVENKGISTASLDTEKISGLFDRHIPHRGQNKYVFVNRFSAPGGPETMGAGYLDVESESFSVYNALPFRNLSVRSPLRRLLSEHSAFGGYDSVLGSPSASFHKTQRNGAKRLKINGEPDIGAHDGLGLDLVTGSTFDNAYIQHMIPQSDMQYSWITASALSAPFGYAQPNPANASMASTAITFLSASEHGSYVHSAAPDSRLFGINKRYENATRGQIVPSDFVGLNTNFRSVIDTIGNTVSASINEDFMRMPAGGFAVTSRTLGTAGQAAKLNALNLKRNGAGGFSSWKQVRQSDHILMKDMRKNNRLSIVRVFPNGAEGQEVLVENPLQVLYSYREPPVTSKYKPLRHSIGAYNHQDTSGLGLNGDPFIIKSSYGNNLSYFTMTNERGLGGLFLVDYATGVGGSYNEDSFPSMTKILNFNPTYEKQVYDDLKRIYINSEINGFLLGSSPIKKANDVNYREVVYPKESNTFLSGSRMRLNYSEASGSADFNRPLGSARTFWRNIGSDRLRNLAAANSTIIPKNSMNVEIVSGGSKTTSYEGVLDLSCWPLEANYPMVQIAPTGASGEIGSCTVTGEGEGSLRLPASENLRTLNGELSYNNWVYNLYRVPMQGETTSIPSTLNSDSPPTASLSYEYPNFALSGSDPNFAGSGYTMAHLNLIPEWTANLTSSRNPWFDSYEDYSEDIKRMGKDYTIVPEFRISDHMEYYIKEGSFSAINKKYLDLIGASNVGKDEFHTSSATSEKGIMNPKFFRLYSHSDFLKHFSVIQSDHVEAQITPDDRIYLPSRVRISCNAIKKLLPYQGFYPATRTVQLGRLFSSSYGPHLTGSYDTKAGTVNVEQQKLSSLLQPFFAPGIMFNTIKSGLAVDWPVITGSIEDQSPPAKSNGVSSVYGYRAGGLCNFDPSWRLPFEALYSPNERLPSLNENENEELADRPDAHIYHIWPNYSNAGIDQSSHARRYSAPGVGERFQTWYEPASYDRPTPNFVYKGGADSRYDMAMNNFLAETVEFFLEDKKLTRFVSQPEKDFKFMHSGSVYMMDVILRKSENFKMYEGPDRLFLNETYNSSSTTAFTASVGCRGMHYGPNFASNGELDGEMQTKQQLILKQLSDPGPAPYTPPYFYGDAVARISFRPHLLRPEMEPGAAEIFTLSEIFSSAEIETVYFNKNQRSNGVFEFKKEKDPITGDLVFSTENFASGTAAYRNQMRVNSSVNLFERFGEKYVSYEPVIKDGEVQYVPTSIEPPKGGDTGMDRWVIETKFECPVLNFFNPSFTHIGAGSGFTSITNKERTGTNGMWRTYGVNPDIGEGIFLEIKDTAPQLANKSETSAGVPGEGGATRANPSTGIVEARGPSKLEITKADGVFHISTTGSLIDVCGFNVEQENSSQKIGKLASSKTISEAVVAIPMNPDGTFVPIPLDSFNKQRQNLVNHGVAVKAGDFAGVDIDIPETSISDMIKKMKKFVIPPHLDFLNNKTTRDNLGPFVMYIFDFSHTLSKNDLSLIWQNMMPDISVTAEEQMSSIDHSVLTGELDFFGIDRSTLIKGNASYLNNTKLFPDDMKWMVFKVKQRGKNNYSSISITKNGQGFGFGLEDVEKNYNMPYGFEKQNPYGYNWPYDFFSLVELAKVEVGAKFKPKKLGIPEEEVIETATSDKPEIKTDIEEALRIGKGLTIIKTDRHGSRLPVDVMKTREGNIERKAGTLGSDPSDWT